MPDVGHHQARHQRVVQLRGALERPAIVEHLDHIVGADTALGGVRVQENLLFTLDPPLILGIAVLAVEERVRLRRDNAERLALGQLRARVGQL